MAAKVSFLGLALAVLSSLCAAQQPQVTNAKLIPRSAQAGLQQELSAIMQADAGPAWIGYAVPVVPGERTMCCLDFDKFKNNPRCCAGCNLEHGDDGGTFSGTSSNCKQLEPAKNFFVLLRFNNRKISKAKAFSTDCGLDVGGLALHWLGEVRAAESVAFLEKQVLAFADADEEIAQHAISAIALHGNASADAALDRLVARDKPEEIREHAAFWLGTARGHHGLETLRSLVRGNESEEFLVEHAVFAISQSHDPEAQPELIRLARNDARAEVRGKALFWLAQRAGKKVANVITDSVERDPDTDVKKKAVFALTQMPHDEGVPLLIQVAKSNRNPVVRKEAIFWLGQSGDSRALDYIESVLAK